MYERLLLLKELLADDGSLYLHCDDRKSHYLRCLMEEVFGAEDYRNEIVWKRTTARSGSSTYNHIHDTILFFTKGGDFTWNQQYLPYSDGYLDSNFRPDERGRLFRETPLTAPGTRTGLSGHPWKGVSPSLIGRGRHWAIPSFVRPLLSEKAQGDPLLALDELE
jgi:adenine-specific DNA-methyltransferase